MLGFSNQTVPVQYRSNSRELLTSKKKWPCRGLCDHSQICPTRNIPPSKPIRRVPPIVPVDGQPGSNLQAGDRLGEVWIVYVTRR